MLSQRVAELREAGILDASPAGYGLTAEGEELLEAYGPLGASAQRWARRSSG